MRPINLKIFISASALVVVGAISGIVMFSSNQASAQVTSRACACSGATRVGADAATPVAPTYVVHCACGSLACVTSLNFSGNHQLVCVK
jgi:hypothetical protein